LEENTHYSSITRMFVKLIHASVCVNVINHEIENDAREIINLVIIIKLEGKIVIKNTLINFI
jgi:hypothetical protein